MCGSFPPGTTVQLRKGIQGDSAAMFIHSAHTRRLDVFHQPQNAAQPLLWLLEVFLYFFLKVKLELS